MKTFITALLCLLLNSIYADWQNIAAYPNLLVRDILVAGGTVYTASSGGVHKSTDGTATWQAVNDGLNGPQALSGYQVILFNNALYVATADGMYKSTNDGTNWIKKSSGIVVGGGAIYAFCKSIFEDSGVLYTGSYTGIYRSTNSGENWVPTNINGSGIGVGYFINYGGTMFAARESINIPGSYKSTDNGVTWSPFAIWSTYLPTITFYGDGPRLYAGTIDGVWLSTNSGASWTEKNTGLSLDPYSSSILRVNGVLLTSLKFGGSGMYRSFNNGDLWLDFKQGLPFLSEINKIIQFNSKILAGTSGGIYQRDVSELTGISIVSNQAPGEFALYQNYPNPFNPETRIRFSVPSESNISMKVYDALGREVASLVNRKLQPGTYEVYFDGSSLTSGVYYYSISAGDFRNTKKMIMVK